jgi:hypothetical protein
LIPLKPTEGYLVSKITACGGVGPLGANRKESARHGRQAKNPKALSLGKPHGFQLRFTKLKEVPQTVHLIQEVQCAVQVDFIEESKKKASIFQHLLAPR